MRFRQRFWLRRLRRATTKTEAVRCLSRAYRLPVYTIPVSVMPKHLLAGVPMIFDEVEPQPFVLLPEEGGE